MNWMTAVLAVIIIVLLFVQGISCLIRAEQSYYVRWFGLLTFSLAGLGLFLCILLFSRTLVLSPEFGIVMVQGTVPRFGLSLLIVGLAIGAGMSLHVTRLGAGWATRLPWLLGIGSIVGFLAAIRLFPLNADDSEPLRIYSYDLWWPPMLIWLIVCLVESGLTILRFGSRLGRGWVASVIIGGLSLYALHRPEFGDPWSKTIWEGCLLIFLLIFLLISLVAARQLYLAWRAGRLKRPRLPKPTLDQSVFLLAFIAITLSLGDLFYFTKINPTLDLTVFILAWMLLAEVTLPGPLLALSQWAVIQEIRKAESPVRYAVSVVPTWLTNVGARVGGWLRGLLNVSSLPVALIKTLVGIALLIALSEIPNAGKTIIQPFRAPASSDQGDKDISHFSDHLLNTLGQLKQELRPDIIIPSSSAPKEKGEQSFGFVTLSGGTSSVDAALTRSSDLELGSVKIPLSVLVAPIQVPMRALLGVRVINGTVLIDQRGYTVLASSTSGEVWMVKLSNKQFSEELFKVLPEQITPTLNDALSRMADELAFEMASSDPTLVSAGMTHSWKAFQPFKDGLADWERFEADQDYDALSHAIQHFREATRKDSRFALAHYRLGLALQKDGQPAAAVEAFRASLKANPNFMAGYLALATTLFDFSYYYHYSAAALSPPLISEGFSHEARRLWKQIIRSPTWTVSPADQASAYYGLCRDTFNSGKYYLAYFYCKRAEKLYSQRDDPEIKTAKAYVLHTLGVILELNNPKDEKKSVKATDWHCFEYVTPEGDLLFTLGLEFQGDLDKGNFPKDLRKEFESQGTSLSENVIVSIEKKGREWLITDENNEKKYSVIRKKTDELNIITHEDQFLFSVDLKFDDDLDKGNFPEDLRKEFESQGISLSQNVIVLVEGVGEWLITDENNEKKYSIIRKDELNITQRSLQRSPYSRAALEYYERAMVLLPENQVIRCNAANTAHVLDDDHRPMEELERDSIARLNLAYSYRIRAENKNDFYYYSLALREYEEAIKLNQYNIGALIGYAYTFWEWWLKLSEAKPLSGPDPDTAHKAENNARLAVRLAAGKVDPYTKVWVRSTLGEVLLAQARPDEAIEELKLAINDLPSHPLYHEIRWDLALAYLCASSNKKRAVSFSEKDVQTLKDQAISILDQIRQNEQTREVQPFTEQSWSLDPNKLLEICQRATK